MNTSLPKLRVVLVAGLALAVSLALLKAEPAVNVSGRRHPNIEAAQRFCADAFNKIVAAQNANEFDMGGHAQQAKRLLDEASHELKLAAEAANEGSRPR